jgi:DNA-directed RNA polymerase sigma subunit (sigma70/sigma32)
MATFLWPAEDGWPYPDSGPEIVDLDAESDDDLMSLTVPAHLFDDLEPVERAVIQGRFGLGGATVRSMRELQDDLGIPRAELRAALGSGLEKLRAHLVAD